MAIGESGTIGRAPLAAGAQRRMATRGFFASRCKAEGGGKKPRGGVAPGRARRSRPRLDQANREAARSCLYGMGRYGGQSCPDGGGKFGRNRPRHVRANGKPNPARQRAATHLALPLAERVASSSSAGRKVQRRERSERQRRYAQGRGEHPRNSVRHNALSGGGTRPGRSTGTGAAGQPNQAAAPPSGVAAIFSG